ncbi:hypothetical protein EJ06DRAFT_278042 [Trichodelitschia bisporula]|uniref:Zn(2)-C6 fungal-type domain-containing protein n=1 Tax=Trichodelitschia bisporula TaxID=703511 RepID=A0A6G1I5I2_9PEZI|nr:hypothetical protein EJ06DRAFT_278042 [Trichodelitschia bisporula]
MSAFRPIRPSASQDPHESDAAPTGPEGTTGATTPGQQSSLADTAVAIGKQRKRKAPTHVSQNACTNCKKARAKCDGEDPAPCTRCISRAVADQCHYEVHVKTAKEELVRKIRDLEHTNAQLKASARAKDRWIESIMQLVGERSASSIPTGELLEVLRSPPLGSSEPSRPPRPDVNMVDSASGLMYDLAMVDSRSDDGSVAFWTSVTADEGLVHHLMALYFAWIHPVHMLFSEVHFVRSFRNKDYTYCTPGMVNAMCALGCCLMTDPTEGGGSGTNIQAQKLGERFYQQVKLDERADEHSTPVFAITYAILFLVELSMCQARKATSHLRLAVESLRSVDKAEWTEEAFEIVLWGIHTLNTGWAAFTYQKPSAPVSPRAPVFTHVRLDGPDPANWLPYRFQGDAGDKPLASHAIATAREFALLMQIVHETINVYCGSRGKVTAHAVVSLHRRYVSWKDSLPAHLSDHAVESPEYESKALPHVLALHIHYCVALCQLFTPLLSISNLPPATAAHIKSEALAYAQHGLLLARRYYDIFRTRYQPPFLAFCLVHLSDVMLRHGQPLTANDVITFTLTALADSLQGFPVVGPLAAMFRDSVLETGYMLPKDVISILGIAWSNWGREDRLECCGRLTYAQPVDLLAERVDESLVRQWEEVWRTGGIDGSSGVGRKDGRRVGLDGRRTSEEERRDERNGDESGAARYMDINTIMNP